jgi:hypothetical protein
MSPGIQIILSGTLTFGVPLGLAVRDLIALRRPSGGDWRPEPPEPMPVPPTGGGSPAQRALPACLLEAARGRPVPARQREVEIA